VESREGHIFHFDFAPQVDHEGNPRNGAFTLDDSLLFCYGINEPKVTICLAKAQSFHLHTIKSSDFQKMRQELW
jgi:hypothetical protein